MLNIQQLLLKRGMKGTNYVPDSGGGGDPGGGGDSDFSQIDVTLTRVAGDDASVRSTNVIPLPPNALPSNNINYFRVLDPDAGNVEVACYCEFIDGTHADRTSPNGIYVELPTTRTLGQTKDYVVDFTALSSVARLSKQGWTTVNDISVIPDPADDRFWKLENDIWLFNFETGVPYKISAQQIPWPSSVDIPANASLYSKRSFRVECNLDVGTISLYATGVSTSTSQTGLISNSPVSGHNDGNRYSIAHVGVEVLPGSTNFAAGSTSLTAAHIRLPTKRIYDYTPPAAVLLPTDSSYLCACEIMGKDATWAEVQALGGDIAATELSARRATIENYSQYSAHWGYQGGAFYGGTTTVAARFWWRTGDLVWWLQQQAGISYIHRRYGTTSVEQGEWNASMMEYVINYMLTGNTDNLTILRNWIPAYNATKVVDISWSQRSHARVYEYIAWVAGRLGQGKPLSSFDYATVAACLDAGLAFIEATASVSGQEGRYPSEDYCPLTSSDGRGAHVSFGVGYVMHRLIDCYLYFADSTQQTRIVDLIELLDTYQQSAALWDSTTNTWRYQDIPDCTAPPENQGQSYAGKPDLVGMNISTLAWRYSRSGDADQLTRLNNAFIGARTGYFDGEKQNQEYNCFVGMAHYYKVNGPDA